MKVLFTLLRGTLLKQSLNKCYGQLNDKEYNSTLEIFQDRIEVRR